MMKQQLVSLWMKSVSSKILFPPIEIYITVITIGHKNLSLQEAYAIT